MERFPWVSLVAPELGSLGVLGACPLPAVPDKSQQPRLSGAPQTELPGRLDKRENPLGVWLSSIKDI